MIIPDSANVTAEKDEGGCQTPSVNLPILSEPPKLKTGITADTEFILDIIEAKDLEEDSER